MTEIYLYEPITDASAEYISRRLRSNPGEDYNIRMRTNGGFTPAGIAMVGALAACTGKIKMSVDGDVASMGAFMLLFADEVEMSEMAEIMFHKAAYPSWYTPKDSEKDNLNRENKRFKKKMQERLGEAGSELVDSVFKEGVRNDVYVTAQKAKNKLGLVDKVVKLSPKRKSALNESYLKAAIAEYKSDNNSNINTMEITQEELDKKIAQAKDAGYAEGVKAGKNAEKERQSAWNVFADVDPEAVKKGIDSGESIPKDEEMRLLRMAMAKDAKKDLEEDNAEGVETGDGKHASVEDAEEAKNKADFEKATGIKL